MSLIELLQDHSLPIAAVHSNRRYLLQGQHSRTGKTLTEGSLSFQGAIHRASELIRAGYAIEIWSPTDIPIRRGW